MEELQDAIEDAQYMNAMQDETPRPTKSWRKVSSEEIEMKMNQLLEMNNKSLDIDQICENCLGFYLFLRFVREHGAMQQAHFLIDIAMFRVSFIMNNMKCHHCNDSNDI